MYSFNEKFHLFAKYNLVIYVPKINWPMILVENILCIAFNTKVHAQQKNKKVVCNK